jgi:hypothetical protein
MAQGVARIQWKKGGTGRVSVQEVASPQRKSLTIIGDHPSGKNSAEHLVMKFMVDPTLINGTLGVHRDNYNLNGNGNSCLELERLIISQWMMLVNLNSMVTTKGESSVYDPWARKKID